MIVYCDWFCKDAEAIALKNCLLPDVTHHRPLDPHTDGNALHTYHLDPSLPHSDDLVLMEGRRVGRHVDPGQYWQVCLALANPGWSIRGSDQAVRDHPQPPGALIVLDISRVHQVTGRRTLGPWITLNWNPEHVPPAHEDMDWPEALTRAKVAYRELMQFYGVPSR